MCFEPIEKTKCSIKGCNTEATIWKCDTCYRPTCAHHYYIIDGFPKGFLPEEQIPVALKELIKEGVRGVCLECIVTAELKEIEDTPDDNLPLLINRNFMTNEAYSYYCSRVSGEKRDPHVFDFLMDIVKGLVKKIKEEEKNLTSD
jgi:hypothetical protein